MAAQLRLPSQRVSVAADHAVRAVHPGKPVQLHLVGTDAQNDLPKQGITHPAFSLPRKTGGVVLIGTPESVRSIAQEFADHPSNERPPVLGVVLTNHAESLTRHTSLGECGDRCAHACNVDELPVLGTLATLQTCLARLRPGAAIVCLPSGHAHQREQIERALAQCGVPSRTIPMGIGEPVSARTHATEESETESRETGRANAGRRANSAVLVPRVIDFAKLIGRSPYTADAAAVAKVLTGKRVLITGAGGSIGSELVRVACEYNPEEIVLVERSENALFEIDRQTATRYPKIKRKAVLHDVVDTEGTLSLLKAVKPHVVFHSAAHKHVPLMEDHPGHAITNNLFGTKSIADAAVQVGCERFVMISSDKAVNPSSVMGATKRLAELYIRHLASRPELRRDTRLSMVRFGNVLGSACSVLTIWGTQLAEGGPLTVTDPRMTRYFMTIPEAATLVIQSAALPADQQATGADEARNAGMYVLDMGEPVRILDLAVRFARMHGLNPVIREGTIDESLFPVLQEWMWDHRRELGTTAGGQSAEIVFSGIRPGEKLYEELAYAAEMLRPTAHPGISAWAGEGALGDIPLMLKEMNDVRFTGERAATIAALQRHVPEMRRGHVPSDN